MGSYGWTYKWERYSPSTTKRLAGQTYFKILKLLKTLERRLLHVTFEKANFPIVLWDD